MFSHAPHLRRQSLEGNARPWWRRFAWVAIPVLIVCAVAVQRGGMRDGWPPAQALSAGLDDDELVRRAGTNLRIRCRNDVGRLNETQLVIIGLLPLYLAGGPDHVSPIAAVNPADGRSSNLEMLDRSLSALQAHASLQVVRERLVPLSRGGRGGTAADEADHAFAAAWRADQVPVRAAAHIRSQQPEFE